DGKLWVIGSTAQPQAEVALPQTLDCAPIRFAGGVLLPLPGRLKLAGRAGGPPCDDFLAPVKTADDAPLRKWKHLVTIDADQLFVVDNVGKLSKLQYRTGDKCFFQTISSLDFPQPLDVPPTLHKDRLITADAQGTLRVLDVTAMETRAEVALGAAASKPLWVAGPLLLAEVGRQKLVAFDIAQPKQPLWTLKLDGNGIVGSPLLIDDALIAVQQTGDVLRIDPKTGLVANKLSLGQIATHGPIRLGNLLVVITADGSLNHVESLIPSFVRAAAETAKTQPPRVEKPVEAAPVKEEKPAEDKPAKDDKPKDDKPKDDKPMSDVQPADEK
ncbi:MAG TPA: PQQ-binding-like beta-propeller repeat protein, partial [Planctomycetaceae bacterium]|nr:PQQ-binding-like beta-propeller repeat protein [Planctomycetaceae bacterium]